MIKSLIEILAPPIDPGRTLRRMNEYLWVTIIVLIVTFSVIFLVNESFTTRLASGVVVVFSVSSIGFLHQGKITFARIAFPMVLYVVITYLIVMGFGIYSQSVPGIIALLIFAALLGGRKVMVSYAALSMLTVIAAYTLEQQGYIVNGLIRPSIVSDLINALVPIIAAATALWFLIRYIEADGDLAKESANELALLNRELCEQRDELNKAESKYRLLAENASDFIWTADMSLNYTFCSPASEQVIGYKPKELLGKSVFEYLKPDQIRRFSSTFEEELKREELDPDLTRFQNLEFEFKKSDGTTMYAESSVSFLRDDNKKVTGIVGSTRDISERLAMEEEHRDVAYQLSQAQKIDSIGHLAGGIAHDFNNLLVVIHGYSDLIRISESNSDTLLFADEIKKASNRAANLTNQLLTFSRRQTMESTPINLNQIIAGLQNMLSRLIEENIRIDFNPKEGLSTILGDAGQLEQVLLNLCLNARDAMSEGGVITITTNNVAVTPDMIVGNEDAAPGDYVELIVADTGHGIDEALADKIFEPFFSTKEKGKGTGLGLSVVYGIVMQHKGFIKVSSRPEDGATFTTYLPKSNIQTPDLTVISNEIDVSGDGELILLVEDEEQVRELVTFVLSRAGYRVIEASDGSLGLRMFHAYSDDITLILSDVIMPEMGGRELMKAIHSSERDVPFVFITGYVDEPDFIQESGFEFIRKPFSAKKLVETIHRVINKAIPQAHV